MIIRRLVTAVRQQDWGLAALDFLIVVAGIFVGLQVDDWNQRLADRDEEKLLLRGLLVDLQTTRADYARSDEQLAGWLDN